MRLPDIKAKIENTNKLIESLIELNNSYIEEIQESACCHCPHFDLSTKTYDEYEGCTDDSDCGLLNVINQAMRYEDTIE